MTARRVFLAAMAVSAGMAGPAMATVTIGSTTGPSGGTPTACDVDIAYIQPTFHSATPYVVPAGGGELTGWSMATLPAYAGVTERMLIVRPGADLNSYTDVGEDERTFPSPIPANNIVSFPLDPPLPVQAGDELGLYNPTASGYCLFHASSSLSSYALETDPISAPAAGASLAITGQTPFDTDGYELDLAATLDNDEDAGVTAAASGGATAGAPAAFTASVTNNGPAAAPITVIDTIDPGLTIGSAVAGDGTCSVSGHQVSCTITVPPGQAAPVSIAVTAASAGTYQQTIAVGTGSFTDPVTANNAAGSTLSVAAAPAPTTTTGTSTTPTVTTTAASCHVPALSKVPLKIAKGVITALGCKVGKTTTVRSKTVARGLVISTVPKAGSSVPAGSTIALRVSGGPPHHKKHRR